MEKYKLQEIITLLINLFNKVPYAMQIFVCSTIIFMVLFYLNLKKWRRVKDINLFVKEETKYYIAYKDVILLKFDHISDYSQYCDLIYKNLNVITDNKEKNFFEFFTLLGIRKKFNNEGKMLGWYFPGFYDIIDKTYFNIFDRGGVNYLKILNYLNNHEELKFSFSFLKLALQERKREKIILNSHDYLNNLNIFFSSFIRNKSDILEIWNNLVYAYWNTKLRTNKNFEIMLKTLTYNILNDSTYNLVLLDKLKLNLFIKNNEKILSILKVFEVIRGKPLLNLLPYTILLFCVFNIDNTYISQIASQILLFFISIRIINFSYHYVRYLYNIRNINYTISFFFLIIKPIIKLIYQLCVIIFIMEILKFYGFVNLLFLVFYINYFINILLKMFYANLKKISRK